MFNHATRISPVQYADIEVKCIKKVKSSHKITVGERYTINQTSLFQPDSVRVKCDTGRNAWYPKECFEEVPPEDYVFTMLNSFYRSTQKETTIDIIDSDYEIIDVTHDAEGEVIETITLRKPFQVKQTTICDMSGDKREYNTSYEIISGDFTDEQWKDIFKLLDEH